MKAQLAANFYNNAGVTPENVPFSGRSVTLINRIRSCCKKLIFPNAKVLEIGCGNGRYAFEFEKMGGIVVGIDCANIPIQYAKEYAKKINSAATFIVADALDMSLGHKTFDIVFLVGNNIVEFSHSDMAKICKQIHPMIKESGVFCVELYPKQPKTAKAPSRPSQVISHYTIPNKGAFEYHSYGWTASMVKNLLNNHFSNVAVVQLDQDRYWFECRTI